MNLAVAHWVYGPTMSEQYVGGISFDEAGDTVYVEVDIDDLDSPRWVGVGQDDAVPGITEVGEYSVKLVDNPHPRRGQTATAFLEQEAEDGALRLVGRTPFS